MNHKIFIDTGPFFAKYVRRDAHHEQAKKIWSELLKNNQTCVTTNFVIAETVTLLSYRFGHKQAAQAAREIYSSKALEVIGVTREIELAALKYLEKYHDQKFSMTDVVSFATMEYFKYSKVFTFDSDFATPGFTVVGLQGLKY